MAQRLFYTETELRSLQGLVKKYGLHQNSIYLGKPAQKRIAWDRLTNEFNSDKANVHRTEFQLRKCWSNLRSRKKTILDPENTDGKTEEFLDELGRIRWPTVEQNKLEKTTEERSQRVNNHHCSCPKADSLVGRPFFTHQEKLCLHGLFRKYGFSVSSKFKGSESERRQAWARLTKEFNSKKSNSTRTQNQLKKWWVNLKTRTKLQPEGESANSENEVSFAVFELAEDPLEPINEVKAGVNFDEIPDETLTDVLEVMPPEMVQEQMALALNIKNEPCHSTVSSLSIGENDHSDAQDSQLVNLKRIEEREEELHRLQVAERQWLVKTAKETYLKARLERESAEELLRFRKAKREEAERKMDE